MGRPSLYTESLADSICGAMMDGHSLRQICQSEHSPHRSTVMRWLADNPDFAAKYARAREAQAEFHHEEMDEIERKTLDGVLNPQVASVVLANKRWRMEKLKPRVYGARIQHGNDPDNPMPAPTFIMMPTAPGKPDE